jgi:LmbE family N-acetylglucosaminyl deacetylase
VPHCELATAFSRHIEALGPHTVYVPHRGDIHVDHRAVYHAALVATRPMNHCPVRRLLSYETLSSTEWGPPVGAEAFVPTVFVEITAFLDRKLRALACYRSQLKPSPNARSLEASEALAHLRGATVGCDAAEAFMLVREIELG